MLTRNPASQIAPEDRAERPANLSGPPRLPGATYRLQFHAGFTFRDACNLVPYLHALGITDLYASPYVKACSGSMHGYDVADPNSLNPELGADADYAALVRALQEHGMGQVLDVVPNHMGIADSGNTWWQDVLENGPSSLYAEFFDIDWNPLKVEIQDRDKVVLPILGDQYGRVLEDGEFQLSYEDGAFYLHYYQFKLPLAPDSYPRLLVCRLVELEAELGAEDDQVLELQSIVTALSHLPPRSAYEQRKRRERNREKEIVKRRIAHLYQRCRSFREAIRDTLAVFNGVKRDARSFDPLDSLLADQAYRLAFWRVAAEEINYRRFFDINELAAVRMEDPRVFDRTHRLLLELIASGAVTGLRIDHPDGLWDPAGYLWRLQTSCGACLSHPPAGMASHLGLGVEGRSDARPSPELRGQVAERVGQNSHALPIYVVVEKILGRGEELPPSWPVHGTTGYDFLNLVNGLFVDRANRAVLDTVYSRFAGGRRRFRDAANSAKKMVMLISLASEVNELGYQLKRIASRNRRMQDFTLNGLTFAIREVIASLPVYRSYIDPEQGTVAGSDREAIAYAVADAKRRNPRTDISIFNFIRDTLLLGDADEDHPEERAARLRFVAKFQQTTGPVMAKGVEDTAFYFYNRLISLNDVGGDPDQFGISLTTFHHRNTERLHRWPHSMLATSTHDTKRSEDVRARINVLSELPRQWGAALTRWSRLNAGKRPVVDGRSAPDRNEEYLLYQTLLAAWPLGRGDPKERHRLNERMAAFMLKALREAKVNTSWISPNAEYEAAVQGFVDAILNDSQPNPFLDDFRGLQQVVAHFGMFNSLSQTLLRLTVPGVPDLYQGTELWDFSLVDPDNRRPVDFDTRARMLQSIRSAIDPDPLILSLSKDESESPTVAGEDGRVSRFAAELLEGREDGRIKMYVVHRGLGARREDRNLFAHGAYLPLRVVGPKKQHVCAFARALESEALVVATPVLVAGLTRGALVAPIGLDIWGETSLLVPGAPGTTTYRNLFTGDELATVARNGKAALPLAEVFRVFPVALMRRM